MGLKSAGHNSKYPSRAHFLNKKMTAVLLAGLITCAALSVPACIFLAGSLQHDTSLTKVPGIQDTSPQKLLLWWEHADTYMEQKLGDRSPGWVAGSAMHVP